MIDERFAFIQDAEGNKYQVLKFDDEGNPIDWDEEKTRELLPSSFNT